MTEPTDRTLLIAAADGEERAFAALYGRYAGRLRKYFTDSLGSNAAADDLTQQVFIQLLDSKHFRQPHGGPDGLDKLLFTIARNLVLNQQRGDRRRSGREAVYLQQSVQLEASDLPAAELTDLTTALDQLPDHQRQPLLLRFRHGLEISAIAKLMNCPPGTIKSRLHYGLKRLARLLHPTDNADERPRS